MSVILTPEINDLMAAVHYRPAVSIIMPFEPKMCSKHTITLMLYNAAEKVEKELEENYPEEMCILIMHKIRSIIKHLNFNTHKKSIAIYVSPVFEKVLYLDITVEEKIIVDETFEIRDLVYSKKQLHKYLILTLSGNGSSIYLGNTDSLVKIVSNTPESIYPESLLNKEKVSNFYDAKKNKEIIVDKFLHYVDHSLDIILKSYRLPLFVMGAERILGHFKKFTKHNSAIIEYVKGNYEKYQTDELINILKPYIKDWNKVRQKELFNELEEAANNGTIAIGITEVWKEAIAHKGKLLIIEKDYMYAAVHGGADDIIYKAIMPHSKFSYIKDAVDDVIEKVLEDGGDVEFVEKEVLDNYNHIALIKHYK
jgi:hypothetical protein